MARRRSRDSSQPGRVDPSSANRSRLSGFVNPAPGPTVSPDFSIWSEVEDRRTFYPLGPDGYRPARNIFGSPHYSLEPSPNQNLRRGSRARFKFRPMVPAGVRFKAPRKILVCVRRKARREVLLALGRGGGGHRRPRRSYFSSVRCK